MCHSQHARFRRQRAQASAARSNPLPGAPSPGATPWSRNHQALDNLIPMANRRSRQAQCTWYPLGPMRAHARMHAAESCVFVPGCVWRSAKLYVLLTAAGGRALGNVMRRCLPARRPAKRGRRRFGSPYVFCVATWRPAFDVCALGRACGAQQRAAAGRPRRAAANTAQCCGQLGRRARCLFP